jgi:Arylsulfotransferase (ASST)
MSSSARKPMTRHRRLLLGGCLLVLLSSVTTLVFASHRIEAENAAFSVPSAGRCTPTTLNRSDLLPGTSIAVSPLPGSYDASYHTQISFLGVPISELSHIVVKGSETGSHSGHLRAYSQGDGASFVLSKPFTQGESVSVSGTDGANGKHVNFSFHFVVAHKDILPGFTSTRPKGSASVMMHFHSRPELTPPSMTIAQHSSAVAPGLLFAAPYSGPGPTGPMIFDEQGNLIWFKPLPLGTQATNLQVQQLGGKPVLTYWQGRIPPQGFGEGEEMILGSQYQQVATVHAGNGQKADLHDFHIMPNGTALLTVFDPIDCNISSLGGPTGGAVTDAIFQEVDMTTGLVRREWHSVDHVPLSDSYSYPVTTSKKWPYDFFHINSIDQQTNGRTLISARNTWTLYELNTVTGQVLAKLGGKHSSLKLQHGANTAYQHDATVQANGSITVFDNGAVPTVHPQSRALILQANTSNHTLSVAGELEHKTNKLIAGSQGNVQVLPNGDFFVGWGAEPYFTEFSPTGEQIFDGHFHGAYQSYRVYRYPWTGEPDSTPSIAATDSSTRTTVYASWNGDTRTASWQLLAGSSPAALAPVASAVRKGFETAIAAPTKEKYVAVQALSSEGTVLATSKPVSP